MAPDQTDQDLVSRLLSSVQDYSLGEVEEMTDGAITASDLSRWRNDNWEYLTGKKRRAIKQVLGDEIPELPGVKPLGGDDGEEAAGEG